jgi:HSP20 family protein
MRRLAGSPFLALERLQRALDRAFEAPSPVWSTGLSGRVFPPVNIFNDQDGALIRAEVPGLAAGDFVIESQNRSLTIRGHRTTPSTEKGNPHRRERWTGDFSRSFEMPDDLELDKAEASYRNGILNVRIPRREATKPRQIAVSSS